MIVDLLEDALLQSLLLFDVVLHGSIVRETMAGVRLDDFVARGGVIVATAPHVVKPYIDRTLFQQILNITVENNSLSTLVVRYELSYQKSIVPLCIGYYKCLQMDFPKKDLDVNQLTLSREGLGTCGHASLGGHPSPLHAALVGCQRREFRIVEPYTDVHFKFRRAKRFIERGWTLVHGGIALKRADDAVPDDDCAVCKEPLNGVGAVIETRCRHCFHAQCWTDLVNSKTAQNALLSIQVHCPLCRHPFMVTEALVPKRLDDENVVEEPYDDY